MDTTAAIRARRQPATAISVESAFDDYVERTLEGELGSRSSVYAWTTSATATPAGLFSREDDFALSVELHAPMAGIQDEFLEVVSGRELHDTTPLLGMGWPERIPDTGVGREEDDQTRAIERRADQRAWLHRAVIQEATRRLALAVARR